MAGKFLTKSKFLNGLQCLKLLWLVINSPEKVPQPDEAKQQLFDQGHLVGELAKKLYPAGLEVASDSFLGNLGKTQQLLAERKPLFEAGFTADRLYCRVDILKPAFEDRWDIVEVKSGTSVKDENAYDVAFQKKVLQMQGLKISKCYLAYINNQYVRQGKIDPAQFFIVQDISEQVEEVSEGLNDLIKIMLERMEDAVCPAIKVGTHCSEPYDCPVEICWQELPENDIFQLYRAGKKCFDLFHSGVLWIKDIPVDYKLSRAQQIQRDCLLRGETYLDKYAVREFLNGLEKPLHFLDFETINPAIPQYDGTRPYQRIPFQYSLHIGRGSRGLEHYGFLADDSRDPRPEFLKHLKADIAEKGSIVTYNQAFEEGVLKELAEAFPEYREWITSLRERLVDLLQPFQSFSYYNPKQQGSASIKHVLPAMTGTGYESLGIANGEDASNSFLNMAFGGVTPEDKQRICADLIKYCGLDTEGMVSILNSLQQLAAD